MVKIAVWVLFVIATSPDQKYKYAVGVFPDEVTCQVMKLKQEEEAKTLVKDKKFGDFAIGCVPFELNHFKPQTPI